MNDRSDMNRLTSKLLILLPLLLIVGDQSLLADPPAYSRDWREFGQAPSDSTQEVERRIWIANDTRQTQRFRVDILNLSGQIIRHFVEDNINPGYLNIYWDKKDDSGLWVTPGDFSSRISIRGRAKTGRLVASFDPAERQIQLYPERKADPGLIRYDVLADSVYITAGIYLWGGKPISMPIKDSLHLKGSYQFRWANPEETHQAAYLFHLKADGFIHQTKISRVIDEKK